MPFRLNRIMDAVWPEVLGIGTYVGAEIVAASVDASLAEKAREQGKEPGTPWAQTALTWVSLLGGAMGLGFVAAPEFSKGLFYASGITVIGNATRTLYQKVAKPEEGGTTDAFALVQTRAKSVRRLPTGSAPLPKGSGVVSLSEVGGNPYPRREQEGGGSVPAVGVGDMPMRRRPVLQS